MPKEQKHLRILAFLALSIVGTTAASIVQAQTEEVVEIPARRDQMVRALLLNPIDVHVGSRVRFRRTLLGMSQKKLGEKIGLIFQQVQKYEKGINRIGASRLFDLAQVLGVPVQFFFEEAPAAESSQSAQEGFAEKPDESSIVGFLRSRDGLELNRAFVRISDAKARRAIVDLVCSLASEDSAA